jgi:4-hydroxy-2-oxoheptanedioate aldolase
MQKIVATCKRHKVPVGHPHVDAKNIESVLAAGYQFIMSAPVKSYAAVEKGRTLAAANKA